AWPPNDAGSPGACPGGPAPTWAGIPQGSPGLGNRNSAGNKGGAKRNKRPASTALYSGGGAGPASPAGQIGPSGLSYPPSGPPRHFHPKAPGPLLHRPGFSGSRPSSGRHNP